MTKQKCDTVKLNALPLRDEKISLRSKGFYASLCIHFKNKIKKEEGISFREIDDILGREGAHTSLIELEKNGYAMIEMGKVYL